MKVSEWLSSFPHISDARDVVVSINGVDYTGAFYNNDSEEWLYVVGKRPSIKGNHCFRMDGDSRDWYVAAYLNDESILNSVTRKYHPFGVHFLMNPWTIPEPIDFYEEKKRTRIPFSIQPTGVK